MKIILFSFLFLINSNAFADLSPLIGFKVEIIQKNNSSIKGSLLGVVEDCNATSETLKELLVRRAKWDREILQFRAEAEKNETTKMILLSEILKIEKEPLQASVYSKIYELNYLTKKTFVPSDRMAIIGRLKEDEIKVNIDDIKSIKILSCKEYNIAPDIEISQKEADMLQSKAEAVWADEQYPEGVVSLISYNEKYNTPEKLEKLLRNFVKGKEVPKEEDFHGENSWWYPVYGEKYQKDFRSNLPNDIFILIYHVQD